ncbi:hypothetical protein PRZ48_006977 [Zasmidium cellare]|uniref:Bacteriophage T5 Orf172 DNA-binding domain-containing protein n=1 Tax=Zasmidium cellare TaxID=395010 RepID=A0ABR0EIV6_ZASCE|nr:hypothetical protein PRZ48_006977 [Zasmidium cellare]
MTNFPHTPEALLGRNDSKNPSSTCKGITSSGRPCRRALASPNGKRKSNVSALNGVVALVEEDGRVQEADFYCWQHKDQAEEKVQQEVNKGKKARRKRSAELVPLQERSSIDTLVQRLGIESVPEEYISGIDLKSPTSAPNKRNSKPERQPKPPRRTETADFADPASRPARTSHPVSPTEKLDYTSARPARKPAKKKPSFWASLCCASSDKDDDYVEIVRHRKRTEQAHRPSQTSAPAPPPRVPHESRPSSTSIPTRKPLSPQTPTRPNQQRASSNPHTNQLLSLIPQTCSPQTTSILLAELIKPISPADEEGYIYIFWLTPQSKDTPSESTARSLLTPQDHRPRNSRRISDVMTEFSYDGNDEFGESSRGTHGNGGGKTIMLKIGRANNITRRMNEWQRQCGYKLNLVRWYPYIPSNTPQTSPERPLYPDLTQPPRRQSDIVRRVPYVKRVERLIHLELAEKRVLRDCRACGKEHREWFEVEASQEGVKGVDECVRRWVEWAECQAENA